MNRYNPLLRLLAGGLLTALVLQSSACSRNTHYRAERLVAKLDEQVSQDIKSPGVSTSYYKRPDKGGAANDVPASAAPVTVSAAGGDADSEIDSADIHALSRERFFLLAIGNDRYPGLSDLQSAVNDARGVAQVLKSRYGFQVRILANATRESVFAELAKLRRELKETDNLVLFYAGHGYLDPGTGEGYWLPSDARIENEARWIAVSSISTMLRGLNAKRIMVISDSCYSGTLTRGISVVRNSDEYLGRALREKSRTVLSSGGLEPVVDTYGASRHSVFTNFLIKSLKEQQHYFTGFELFSLIRHPVELNANQRPDYADIRMSGHEGGDFLFFPVNQ